MRTDPSRRALLRTAGAGAVGLALVACGAGPVPTRTDIPNPTKGPPMPTTTSPDLQVLDRLRDAIGSHDPARVAACFTEDYRAELPHHPERTFTGADQVRRNWMAMFSAVPDITAAVLRAAAGGAEIWAEWEMTGTAPNGVPVAFVGPVVLTTRDGRIAWARFYLDRVGAPV
jgi:ketosteroid isomerase-like protein